MTDMPAPRATNRLWQRGILPARPGKCIYERAYIQPRTSNTQPFSSDWDALTAKSLANYRIDRIVLTGYFECEQHPESICAWRLQNGCSFLCLKSIGNGVAVLVNTSADDSLGALTKSDASVAFCRYLLGPATRIGEHSFAYGQQVMLPASDMELKFAGQKQFWVQSCDGRKNQAAIADSFLLVPGSGGIGWIKTLTRPVRYAGINLSEGETDMTRPTSREVASAAGRIFLPDASGKIAEAELVSDKDYKPVWKIFAWIIIALLLVEPAVANRLKR